MTTPERAAFLAGSIELVRAAAPATVAWMPGGSRRRAMLNGMPPDSEVYAQWATDQTRQCIARLFSAGVQHVCIPALTPYQAQEAGRYRERYHAWLEWGLAGPEALAAYTEQGWRVRVVGDPDDALVQKLAQQVAAATTSDRARTVWWHVTQQRGDGWQLLLAAAARNGARTQAELIQAYYGEAVPPAGIWIGFGKPAMLSDVLPLILNYETQCYWPQSPGYELDERAIRQIIYDYAYVRPTWQSDKRARYADVAAYQEHWDQPVIIGLGQRLGAFWYPDSDGDST